MPKQPNGMSQGEVLGIWLLRPFETPSFPLPCREKGALELTRA